MTRRLSMDLAIAVPVYAALLVGLFVYDSPLWLSIAMSLVGWSVLAAAALRGWPPLGSEPDAQRLAILGDGLIVLGLLAWSVEYSGDWSFLAWILVCVGGWNAYRAVR